MIRVAHHFVLRRRGTNNRIPLLNTSATHASEERRQGAFRFYSRLVHAAGTAADAPKRVPSVGVAPLAMDGAACATYPPAVAHLAVVAPRARMPFAGRAASAAVARAGRIVAIVVAP